jgi:hypothetical protein
LRKAEQKKEENRWLGRWICGYLLAEHIQLSALSVFQESDIFSARLSVVSRDSTDVPNDESPSKAAAAFVF